MNFASPWFLLLLIPLVAIAAYALKRKGPSIIIPSLKPLKTAGMTRKFDFKSNIPFFIFLIATSLLIIALARPQKGIEELKQRVEGIDIMLVIDVSGSMSAIDIPEKYKTGEEVKEGLKSGKLRPRIEIAKDEIRKFIERRPNDRIGLVAFAPLPYVACPPTLDRSWLYSHLERLTPGIYGDSTGIAGPISSAAHRLKSCESKRKVVVLFTDGKNNVNAKITPLQAAKLAKTFDIVIYTVGIGSKTAYVIQDGMWGKQLVPLQFEFDEKLLKDIADTTGGKYFAAKDAKGLEDTMSEIDKLEKTTVEQPRYVDYREFAPPLMLSALALLLLGAVMQNTVSMKIP